MKEKYTEAELIETLPAPAKEAIANANLPASKAASRNSGCSGGWSP